MPHKLLPDIAPNVISPRDPNDRFTTTTTITETASSINRREDHIEIFFGHLPGSHKIMLERLEAEGLGTIIGGSEEGRAEVKVTYGSLDFRVVGLTVE